MRLTILTGLNDQGGHYRRLLDTSTSSWLKEADYRFYQITNDGLLPSDDLCLVVRNRLVFLNYLLSTRNECEIACLFESIRDRVRKLDLTKTSKNVSPKLLAEMQARATDAQFGAVGPV